MDLSEYKYRQNKLHEAVSKLENDIKTKKKTKEICEE